MINHVNVGNNKKILLVTIFLILATACSSINQVVITPSGITPTSIVNLFVPGDPTATPLGTDITDSSFVEGVSAYDAKKYKEVVTLMSKVIQSNPMLAPPYRYRGLAYWYLEDCNSALADFEQAISIDPKYAAAWAGRGLANSCFENWDQALSDFQKALSIDPSLAFVHHNLGIYYNRIGDYQKALDEYSLTVAIDSNRSGAWSGKADVLTKLGMYRECITNATKALEINPDEVLAYALRGYCENTIGDHLAAEDDFKIYLSRFPSDAKTWYNLGIAQDKTGDLQESIISYSKALALDTSYYPAYINRGVVYVELERYEDALVDYNQALQFGDIGPAYSGRGDAYYGLKEYDLAITDYKTAISIMPNQPHSYCFLALVYFDVGRYQDSLDMAKTSYAMDPSCGGQRLFEYQGRSYYALGNYEQAGLYMDKALQKGEYKLGYYYRGIIYHDAGKYEKALQDLNTFLMYSPNEINYKSEIADAKKRLAELTP